MTDTSSNVGCDSIVTLGIAPQQFDYQTNASHLLMIGGSAYMAGSVVCTVDWGDGTTSTHTGQSTTAGTEIQFQPYPQHVYASQQAFQINVSVMNPDNQSSASTTLQYSMSSCPHYIYGYVSLDCDGDGQIDSTMQSNIPFDVYGNNGSNSGFTLMNNFATLYGLTPGTYVIDVNSAWMNANGYVVQGGLPMTIQVSPNGQSTFQVVFNCDSVPSNTGCVQGMLYCDDNGNGSLDSNEMGIPNAPIEVDYLNNDYYGMSNNNGLYQVGFPNGGQGAATITVNAQWLAQNGYYLPNNTMTVTATQCSATGGLMYNFAINCDSAQIQNECVAGIVFCDVNGDGFQDANENPMPYAPVEITGANATVTVYANGNGYFGYYGTSLGSNTATVAVNNSWLVQHGYSSNMTVTASTTCDSNSYVVVPINCGSTGAGCADMWTSVSSWIGYYQNYTNYIKLKWGNYDSQSAGSYDLTLTFPTGVIVNTTSFSNQNFTVSGNTYTWTVTPSNASYFYNTDVISFFVPQGFPSGTQHFFTSTITPTGSNADCNYYNDNGSLMMILGIQL